MLRVNRSASFEWHTATERDAEAIHALLEQSALPTADIAASRPEFIVAYEDATLRCARNRRAACRSGWLEHDLPVRHVDPAVELVAHFFEVGDVLESELLVESQTGVVRQGDSADSGMYAARFESR